MGMKKQVPVGDLVNQEDIHMGTNTLNTMIGIMQGFELISLRPQYPQLGSLPPSSV